MLEWAAFFLWSHDPVTQFQTYPATGSGGCCLGFRLDVPGLQSSLQVRLFLALDDRSSSLQHPQCGTASLSLVQPWCARLLLALRRIYCWTVSGRSVCLSVYRPDGSVSFGYSGFDLARWFSDGTHHSQTCSLSPFHLIVAASEWFSVEVLRRLNDPSAKHSCPPFPRKRE